VLWVDQICVNQSDLDERRHQVEFMASIYGGAIDVLIWLGPDTFGDDVRNCFRLAPKVQKLFRKGVSREKRIVALKPFIRLCNRAWFHRAWTFQEICLASTATVYCGRRRLKWATLWKSFCHIDIASKAERVDLPKDFHPRKILHMDSAATFLPWTTSSFLDVLEETRDREASDPRDKVFSLLSHPNAQSIDGRTPIVEADYTMSTEECFAATARRIIAREGNLRIMAHTSYDMAETEGCSWAPRWHEVLRNKIIWRMPDHFDACGKFVLGREQLDRITKRPFNRSILELEGFKIDVVESFGFDSSLEEQVARYCRTMDSRTIPNPKLRALTRPESKEEMIPLEWSPRVLAWHEYCSEVYYGRVFFTTPNGYVGLGPSAMENGDQVFVLFGARVPFLLRKENDQYRLVGECVVTGLMWKEIEILDLPAEIIEIF